MSSHLIIDGNAVYEVDEDCMRGRYKRDRRREGQMYNGLRRGRGQDGGGCQNWGCCSKEI